MLSLVIEFKKELNCKVLVFEGITDSLELNFSDSMKDSTFFATLITGMPLLLAYRVTVN